MDEVQRFGQIVRIPVTLDGETVYIEASVLDGEEDVAVRLPDFSRVTRSIGAIAAEVGRAVRHLQPDNVKLEMGCDIGVEAGELTAILVKGTARANLKITLGWDTPPEDPAEIPASQAGGAAEAPDAGQDPGLTDTTGEAVRRVNS